MDYSKNGALNQERSPEKNQPTPRSADLNILDVLLQPANQIAKHLVLVCLIVHFVTAAGVELQLEILNSGGFQHLVYRLNPLAVGTYGVLVPGINVNGQILLQILCPCLFVDMDVGRQHIPVGGHGEGKAALGVSGICRPDLGIPAEPGVSGTFGFNALTVGAHAHIHHKFGDILRAP